jgi:hypothetical protein
VDQGWVVFAAVAGGLLWLGGYVIACAIWPFAACRKCDGAGRFLSPSGRAWRHCRRCKGSGSRVRTGRRIATWLGAWKKSAIG